MCTIGLEITLGFHLWAKQQAPQKIHDEQLKIQRKSYEHRSTHAFYINHIFAWGF